MAARFSGTFVALVTPFQQDGAVDRSALRLLIEHVIDGGVQGVVPCGTTGEKSTLSVEEHKQVIEWTIEQVDGRVAVIAGTGSNDTRHAAEMAEFARRAGADAALSVVPYYNKPTQEGLYRHYSTIAEKGQIPLIIYNIPGRTSTNLLPETLMRLWTNPLIAGLKDASGNVMYSMELNRVGLPEGFSILAGDDALTLPIINVGGHGCISVAANEIPAEFSAMTRMALEGNQVQAVRIQNQILPLLRANFLETNPIPVKTALGMMGMFEPHLRLPLCEMSDENKAKLREVLLQLNLIYK